jgi:rhamnosyltransferase subunit B
LAAKRIVIATLGSLGDLHPYIALARGLQTRGHELTIATPELYRERVQAAGLGLAPLGSNFILPDRDTYARVLNSRKGVEHLFRDLVIPTIREIYDQLRGIVIAEGADLLISNPLVFAAPLLAEKLNLPWASTVLAPMSFFSIYDPCAVPGVPAFIKWGRGLRFAAGIASRSWFKPIIELRRALSLSELKENPLLEGQHSPLLVLAMFSPVLGTPQKDWPAQARQTGFCFYDEEERLTPELERFLDAGEPPIVFTLGSTAVNAPRNFYEESAAAANMLGRRALLIGAKGLDLPDGVEAIDYASYAAVFPRAAAIVHQGGVGTTAQALRAGVPSLIVPFNFDQPDNGARIRKLGVGGTISLNRFNRKRAAEALEGILGDPSVAAQALATARQIRNEDGVEAACDAIGQLL